MTYTLILGDCLEKIKKIKDQSIDLILIDPPYVGMVNQSWDRLTENEASYFFKNLLEQSYRVLRYGGRFVSFGSNDTLKYLYEYSDLKHRELLIIDKGVKEVSAGRNTKQYKQHINHCEYVFVATKYAREYVKSLLLFQSKKYNKTSKEINKLLGVAENGGGMWSIYTGNNKCNQVPTKDKWEKFKNVFPELPEFETFEEVFNNDLSKGNILQKFNFKIPNRKHPTQKPVDLLEYLIDSYSRENDTIFDPTMGSGSTGVAAIGINRNFIGIETNEEYFKIAEQRIKDALPNPLENLLNPP